MLKHGKHKIIYNHKGKNMKLWQLNVKLRKFSDRMGWPLVTRARFKLNSNNYDAEIELYERQLRESRDLIRNLKQQLAEAQRNDHRNADTGRYEKPQ